MKAPDRIEMKKDGDHYFLGHQEVPEAAYLAVYPPPVYAPGPLSFSAVPVKESDALAVHPRSVEKFREDAKKKGVPTDFTPDGSPIFVSRDHQKRYLKLYGYHNQDGGYGD